MGQSQLTPFFLQTLFIHLLLLLTLASGQQQWDGVAITGTNYQALQAFKRALEDPKGFLKSWNNDTAVGGGACSGDWLGIRCVQGQVTVIQLPWKGLGGRISDRIDQLKALTRLSLHDNSIGGQIPSALGSLPRLRGLYLFSNRFTGAIPPSIGNCLLLRTLDLSNNSLTGLIPDALSNSTRLYRLNLSYNRLAGRIPAGLTRSPSLNFLSLQHNNLHGSIPDTWGGAGAVFNFIEALSSNPAYQLQALNLDHNSLTGNLPTSLSRLQMLQEITISGNQIDGSIPEELARLSMLQTLDISNNAIRGSFPASLCNLSSLAKLNLESNFLGNHIPEAIDGLKNLSFLSLRRNQFQGRIPATLGSISSLKQLDLSENNFFGEIPASFVHLNELVTFNVSDNNLSGPVPLPLSERFNSTSFFGNIQLCGYSISVPCSPPPSPSPSLPPSSVLPLKHHDDRKLTTKDIILIAAGAVLAFFLLLLCCLLLCCLIRKRTSLSKKGAVAAGTDRRGHRNQGPEMESSGGDAGGKLVHFDGPLAFTADDLLCATAEVIGKSGYGTVYRATLEDGNQVAVKRLREKIAKNHREFEAEVNELGKIRHPNLLALRAYYMGPKGEKLLVSDIMPKGSLAAFLHARGPDTPIDWPTRMNIAMGMARGLHYLHSQQKMVHGDLASSNILLDENTNAKIADFGLSRLMTSPANANVALGYCAPELSKLKKANTKTDVYSLGVIILELLTGKSPGEAMNNPDLPQWVASIVKEEWTNEVFDLELMKDAAGNSTGDELLNTLKLALHCVDPLPDARPDAQQVLQQLEKIKPDLAAGAEVSTEEGDRAYDQ